MGKIELTVVAIKGKIRRFFLPKLYPDYVKKQLDIRQGKCLQCGKCCVMLYRCPFLKGSGDNIRCLIYNSFRPRQCKLFPIDERDLQEIGGPCGYSFSRRDS
jgi:hypothetical protein